MLPPWFLNQTAAAQCAWKVIQLTTTASIWHASYRRRMYHTQCKYSVLLGIYDHR